IAHELRNLVFLGAVVCASKPSLLINQNEPALMNISSRSIGVFIYGDEIVTLGQCIYRVTRSSQELPLVSFNPQLRSMLLQFFGGVIFIVNGMRCYFDVLVVLEFVIDLEHIAVHDRADRRAGSEKKVGYVNLVSKIFLGYNLIVLIYKTE